MQSIQTTAHFAADGSVTLKAPGLTSPGEHSVILVVDESSDAPWQKAAAAFFVAEDSPGDEAYDGL